MEILVISILTLQERNYKANLVNQKNESRSCKLKREDKYCRKIVRTTGIQALKQVVKAFPTTLHVAVGKEHVAKNSSAKKPLPPAKRKAVGKAFATC